jgi:hypothetical protein
MSKTYKIIDTERDMYIDTDNVDDVINYLYNYKDLDFRGWSKIMDDDLSYIDGKNNLRNILLNHKGGEIFDWSYETRFKKYINRIIVKNI